MKKNFVLMLMTLCSFIVSASEFKRSEYIFENKTKSKIIVLDVDNLDEEVYQYLVNLNNDSSNSKTEVILLPCPMGIDEEFDHPTPTINSPKCMGED